MVQACWGGQKAAELFYEEICLHACREIPIWLQMDRDPRFRNSTGSSAERGAAVEAAEPPVAHRLANHQGSPMGQSMANAPRVWTAFGMRFLPPGAAHCRRPGGKAFQRRTPNRRGAFAARDLHLTDLQMCSTGSCVARKCAIPHLVRIWNEKRVTTHE